MKSIETTGARIYTMGISKEADMRMCKRLADSCHGDSFFIEDNDKKLYSIVVNALVRSTELSLENAKFEWKNKNNVTFNETLLDACFRNEL